MLQVEHLTRRYGKVTAVDDLSFEISDDGVYGFLGPNGAGKSTTMNIMTGCLSATSGTVRISGYDIYEQPKEAKRRIGYLPEQPPLYLGETPAEYLRFVGEAKGLRGDALRREIEDAIEETGIGEMRSRRIDALSKGYRQRVGIAQALLGTPEIVILDEPTVGLDPLQILEIRSLIASLGRSRTVLISSHILSEVQTMCSKILIIAHGRAAGRARVDHHHGGDGCPAGPDSGGGASRRGGHHGQGGRPGPLAAGGGFRDRGHLRALPVHFPVLCRQRLCPL